MKTFHLYLYSFIGGLLLAFGWFPHGLIPLLFVGFVPLLQLENLISKSTLNYKVLKLFMCSYISFFTWNILTTWWIKNASLGGAAMAIVSNALLMTIVFMLYSKVKNKIGERFGFIVFTSFWLCFEFIHYHWDLSWTWLTLGNGFADCPAIIQWYEYTGVFGGSLWILLINWLVFSQIQIGHEKIKIKFEKILFINITPKPVPLLTTIVTPILISLIINYSSNRTQPESSFRCRVVIVQPNIDPYNEKFDGDYEKQIKKMFALATMGVDSSTDYLLFPETALTEDIWESEINESQSVKQIREYLKNYPKLKIVIGASTAKAYKNDEKLSATARKFTNENAYYDAFNTALQLDNSKNIQIYHKSKLVPGVEKMPFPWFFKYFEKLAIDMGGTIGSLGTQEERVIFSSSDNSLKTAPVICYESIFGEYVGEYINNGAQFISIITNDGWWGDTPGYNQHLKYGRLRAIETRKWIARSANTGVSCFINPGGEILQPTKWWVPAVIQGTIELNDNITFYTKYGDYIARIAMYLSVIILIYYYMLRFRIVKF